MLNIVNGLKQKQSQDHIQEIPFEWFPAKDEEDRKKKPNVQNEIVNHFVLNYHSESG